ncbi:hypothetical protein R5R35_010590 [Gryllus longicercus]|uniref:Rap-GAP domain-containing protein n=1 Tax=Gryllus longicercus TaxID=2509291 RepID=A0AAN9Z2B4_9ORTH
MLDFIHAANTVVCSSDLSGLAPRTEATSILGALVCLPQPLTSVPVLQPSAGEFNTIPCPDAKEYVLSVLLRCGKREPAALARCIALSSLGMYVYQQLLSPGPQPRVREAVNVLLLALRLTNRSVGRVAADILLLLCDHANSLVECYPDLPPRIIEVAALTLAQLAPTGDRHLLTSLMFCLGEWCMQVPIRVLTEPYNQSQKAPCLLQTVFSVLCQLQSGSSTMDAGTTTGLFPPEYMQDFEPSIQVDNLREASEGPVAPPAGLSVKLAARMVVMHLVNHLGHFPMGIGAARLSSLVVEHDDVPGLVADELSAEVFAAPNIQLFVVSDHLLVSLVELPALEVPGGGVTAGLCTAPSQVRVLLRDLSGKACWDASILHCSPEDAPRPSCQQARVRHNRERDGSERQSSVSLMASSLLYGSAHCPPQHTLRHRPPNQLPTWENAAEDMDNLDDLLQYIGHTSPECLESLDTPRNIPAPPPPPLSREAEEDAITTVLGQRNAEQEFLALHACEPIGAPPAEVITAATGPVFRAHSPLVSLEDISSNGSNIRAVPELAPFQHCRLLFSQLGLAGWEHRSQLHLLAKNEKLLRELRNLDTQRCRETHKVAVVYVAEGQEDKNSILSNTCGSQAYEEFIAGLAWEVELESHTGFLGGLQRNKSTGETAPYFATSFTEVIFHVATRMPSSSQESLLQKTRHLGNDEVHIVWSEHTRDYRRGIIPTEFCDVLIVIYPLPNKLFRVQVTRKPEVPFFGPLFNEAIVDHKVLPGLVRATAINASRAKRSMLPLYQNYYEERSKSLETVVRNHKEATTFEEFAAQVYSPVQTASPFCPGPTRSSGTSLSSRSPEPSCPPVPSSTLAAALLDSHQPRHGSSSTTGDARLRGPDGIRVWFASNEPQSADGGLHGISPRPLKKLSFKTTARKSLAVKPDSLTPPDSPTTRKSK